MSRKSNIIAGIMFLTGVSLGSFGIARQIYHKPAESFPVYIIPSDSEGNALPITDDGTIIPVDASDIALPNPHTTTVLNDDDREAFKDKARFNPHTATVLNDDEREALEIVNAIWDYEGNCILPEVTSNMIIEAQTALLKLPLENQVFLEGILGMAEVAVEI